MKKYAIINYLSVCFMTVMLFSCDKEEPLKPVEPKYDLTKVVTDLNVAYGTDKANVMDIYLPANRSTSTTKVILLLHGGAWAAGDKTGGEDDPHFKTLLDSVRRKYPDWAVFNMNYRLATLDGKNIFPSQENDVAAAVKYMYDNRQALGISDKWVFMGMSAGAHLALLQAYKNSSPVRPKAVVDFYGPTDMTDLYNFYSAEGDAFALSGIRTLMSGTPTANSTLYKSSSPIEYVNASSPPTLIMHGGKDETVPERQSLALSAKLKAAGVKTVYGDYYSFAYQTHGWSDPVLWAETMRLIGDFLTTNVP